MLQAIREIYTVEQGEIRVHLPVTFWGQQVEIIVLPMPAQDHPTRQKKSLRGCLQQYANPALIAQEQEAWQAAMLDKHAPR
jgi:hypothetical protein